MLNTVARLRDQLHSLASRDPLTGVLNRRGFDEAVAALTQSGGMALLICDIDHFKRVNDSYGHETGDEVLKAVASHLLRLTLSRPGALLARFGGEEFVAALPNSNVVEAQHWAEKARALIEDQRVKGVHGTIKITMSIGVASAAEFKGDPSPLISRADAALYGAKKSGRNRVIIESELDKLTAA